MDSGIDGIPHLGQGGGQASCCTLVGTRWSSEMTLSPHTPSCLSLI